MKYSKVSQLSTILAITSLSSVLVISPLSAATDNVLSTDQTSSPLLISQVDELEITESRIDGDLADEDILQQYPEEIDAWATTEYDYWDNIVLADYWGTSTYQTKAIVGEEVLEEDGNLENVDESLIRARSQAADSVADLRYYNHFIELSGGDFTYDNVVKLAEYWDNSTPSEAKLIIETYLIGGHLEELRDAVIAAEA